MNWLSQRKELKKKKTNKTIISGSLVKDYSIAYRITDKSSFKLTNKLLEELLKESKIAKKLPLLVLGIRKNDKEMFMIEGIVKVKKYER